MKRRRADEVEGLVHLFSDDEPTPFRVRSGRRIFQHEDCQEDGFPLTVVNEARVSVSDARAGQRCEGARVVLRRCWEYAEDGRDERVAAYYAATNACVLDGTCPNFVVCFDQTRSGDGAYSKEVLEAGDGDFVDYMTDLATQPGEVAGTAAVIRILAAARQVLAGTVATLAARCRTVHGDLYPRNLVIFRDRDDTRPFVAYAVDGETFFAQTFGVVVAAIDPEWATVGALSCPPAASFADGAILHSGDSKTARAFWPPCKSFVSAETGHVLQFFDVPHYAVDVYAFVAGLRDKARTTFKNLGVADIVCAWCAEVLRDVVAPHVAEMSKAGRGGADDEQWPCATAALVRAVISGGMMGVCGSAWADGAAESVTVPTFYGAAAEKEVDAAHALVNLC